MEESFRIIQEDALQSELVRVEAPHTEDDDSQDEAENGNGQLPAQVVAEKSKSIK